MTHHYTVLAGLCVCVCVCVCVSHIRRQRFHVLSGSSGLGSSSSSSIMVGITTGAVIMTTGVPLLLHLQLHSHFISLLSIIMTSRGSRWLQNIINAGTPSN